MKINENINAKESCNSEESAELLIEANCNGAMGQEVNHSQGTEDAVDEKPPSENGRIKYKQVIKELSDRFMERDVTDRNSIVACSQEDQSSSKRKKSSLLRSSRRKTCINLPMEKRRMSEKRGLKQSDNRRGSEETSASSPSPGIPIDKEKESSSSHGSEKVPKQVEKEFKEQPQLLAVLEALSQFATQSLAVGQTRASFIKEKPAKASFTDTKYKAKEFEAKNSQSESKYASHEIMQEAASMSLPVMDGISHPTDVEVCAPKLSDLDHEKENTDHDKAENSHLDGKQINVEIEKSENLRPQPALRLSLTGAKTFSENQEENIQAETISQECAVTVFINHNTIETKSDRAENLQSEFSSCQLKDEAKKSSDSSGDLKEKEHLEKQDHALESKMPCTKSLVALFSNMHNQAQSLISCEKERSSLSFQFPKAEKASPTKSSLNGVEQHLSASSVFKDMLPAETTSLEDACSCMTTLSVQSGPKSEDAKKYYSREVRVSVPRGLSSPTQIVVSPTDQQKAETEPADTNAQSVEAILLVLESMQRTLEKISSKTILSNKEKGQEDILQGVEQGNNHLAKSSLYGSTPKYKYGSSCVQERVGGRMCKTRLAYNIANHIVGQAVRKIVELYPEYFARLSSCRSGDLDAQSNDFSSSTSMAMDALREVLNDLNGDPDGGGLEAEVPKSLTSTAVGTSDLPVDHSTTEFTRSVAPKVVNDLVTTVVSEAQLSDKTVQTESDFNFLPTQSDAEGKLHYYCPEKQAWRLSYELVADAVKEAFSSVSDRKDSAVSSIRRSVSDPDLKEVFKIKTKFSEAGPCNEMNGLHPVVESLVAEGAVINELVRTLSDSVCHLVLNVYRHMDVPATKADADTGEVKVEHGCYYIDSALVVEEKSLMDNMDTEKRAAFNCNHSTLKMKQPESEGLVSSSVAASYAVALLREVLEKKKNAGATTQLHSRGVGTEPFNPERDEEDSRSQGGHHAYSHTGEKSRLSTAENGSWTSQLSQPMVVLGGYQTCTDVQCQMSESSSLDVESSLEGLFSSPAPSHVPQARVSVSQLNDCESSDPSVPASASRLLRLHMERERMNRELRGMLQYCLQRDTSSLFRPLDAPATEMTMGHPDMALYADAFRPGPSNNRGRSPRLRREDPLTEGPKAEQVTSKSVTSLRNELPDLKAVCVNHPGHRAAVRASRATKEFSSISEPRLNTTIGNARQGHFCSGEEPYQVSQSPYHDLVLSDRLEVAPASSPYLELNVSHANQPKIPFERPYSGKVFTAKNDEDGLASFFTPTSAKQPEKYYQTPAENCVQFQPPTSDRNVIRMSNTRDNFPTSSCAFSHFERKDASTTAGDPTGRPGSRTSVEQKDFVQMASAVPSVKTAVGIETPVQKNSPRAVPFPSVKTQGQTWCNFCGGSCPSRKEDCNLAPETFTSQQADTNDQQTQQFFRQVFNLHRVKEAIDEQLQELNAQYVEMRKLHSARQENAFTPRCQDSQLHQQSLSPLLYTQVADETMEVPVGPSLTQHEMDRAARGLRDSMACAMSSETENFIGDAGGGHLPKQHIYTAMSPWSQDSHYSFGPEVAKFVENKSTEAYIAMMKLTIEEHLKQIQSAVRTMPSEVSTVQNIPSCLDASPWCKHDLQPCISAMERSSHRTGGHDLNPQLYPLSYALRQLQEANSLKHSEGPAPFCPSVSPELFLSGGHSNFRHLARVPNIPFDSRSQKPFINEMFGLSEGQSEELCQSVTSSPVCGQSAPAGICSQCNPVDCLAQSKTISAAPPSHSNCSTTICNPTDLLFRWENVHDLRTSGDVFSCVGLGENPEKVVHNEKDAYLCNSGAANEVSLGENGCHSSALATSHANDCNPDTKLDSQISSTYPDVMTPQDSVAEKHYFSGQSIGVSIPESEAMRNNLNSKCAAKQAHTLRARSLSPGSQHQSLKGLSLIPFLMTDRQAGVVHAFDTSAPTFLSESFKRDSLKDSTKTELGNSLYLFRPQPLGAIGIVTEVDAVSSCVDTERKNTAKISSFTVENLGADSVAGHTCLEQDRQADRIVRHPNSLNSGADDAVHAGHFSTAELPVIKEDESSESVSRFFYASLQPDCNLNSTYDKARSSMTNYRATCAVNNVVVSAEFAGMDSPDGVAREVSGDLSEIYSTQVAAGSDWHFRSGCASVRSEDTPTEAASTDETAERHRGMCTEGSFLDVVTSQAGHSGSSDSGKVTKAHQVYKISSSNTFGFELKQEHDCRGNSRNRWQQVTPGTNGRNLDAKKFWQIYNPEDEDVQKAEAGDQHYTDMCSSARSPDLGRCRSSVEPILYYPTERKFVGEDLPYPGCGHSFRNHGRFLPYPDATGTSNFSLHRSTSKSNSFVAEERLPGEHGTKTPFSINFSDSEAGDSFLKPYRQVARKASVSCTEFYQESRLGCCSHKPRSTEAVLGNGEQTLPEVPRVLQSASRMWRQHKWDDHHDDSDICHKEHNLQRDHLNMEARLRSVEHVLRRLEDLAHHRGDGRQRTPNTALPVTTRREVTAPQLACGGQQLLQLVQHQISGSKEVLEMGKNMTSSLGRRRFKTDSATVGRLGFSSSNASSSICSVNPVPDLSDSSLIAFPTASTQISSSGSGSGSDTSLSREKIDRQSFKIQYL